MRLHSFALVDQSLSAALQTSNLRRIDIVLEEKKKIFFQIFFCPPMFWNLAKQARSGREKRGDDVFSISHKSHGLLFQSLDVFARRDSVSLFQRLLRNERSDTVMSTLEHQTQQA